MVLFAGALLLAPASAYAQDGAAQARVHYQNGKDLFGKGDFKAAIAEFAAADSLASSPILEFNIALCYEKLDDKAEALRRYKLFLEKMPSAANKADVEAKIARLEKELEEERLAAEKAAAAAAKPPPDQPLDPALFAPAAAAAAAAATPETAPTSTGDAELDRVSAIDIRSVRDQRLGGAQAGALEPAATGAPPAGTGAPPSPGTQAGAGQAGQATPVPAPGTPADKDDDDPVYKKWWFWVVMGLSAIIVVEMFLIDDSSSSNTRLVTPVFAPQSGAPDQAGGAVLMRF